MLLYLLFTRKLRAMEPSMNTETRQVDAYLSILTTINKGIVELLGPASKGLIFGTGVEEGKRLADGLEKTDTIQKAIKTLNEVYHGVWGIELHHKEGESYFYMDDLGQPSFNIMIRECPIRPAVKLKGLEQCGPICYLTNGYLCGMLGEILGEKVGMEIVHAGPLACKKRIFFRN